MQFTIKYSTESIQEIELLPKAIQIRVKRAIEEKLMSDPVSFGKPLRYSLKGIRSLRVGDYRVLYEIEYDIKLVYIVKVSIRRDVYD